MQSTMATSLNQSQLHNKKETELNSTTRKNWGSYKSYMYRVSINQKMQIHSLKKCEVKFT